MLSRRHCLSTIACAAALALFAGVAPAAAQSAAPAEVRPPPALEISDAQRQLIYASISKQTHKSTAAPPTFGATVGAVVPDAIELSPLPDTIVETVPQTRGYLYAFIANQVLIVDRTSRRIVEIITQSA